MTAACTPALEVEGVGKSFGGLKVLSDVSLTLRPGEAFGLIGPNGAGKTTLFNIVTGFITPDRGRILLSGEDITRTRPDHRVRAGLVRTFQKSMVFPELEVRENLAIAVRSRRGDGYRWLGGRKAVVAANEAADALLTQADLSNYAEAAVASLSYGEQRIIDVLVSLAMAPRVLLLDEPTAGLSNAEGEHLIEVVRSVASDTSIMLIAHDLDIVFGVCDRVAVLDHGRLIACGTPDEIREHEGAQAAYLGVAPVEMA